MSKRPSALTLFVGLYTEWKNRSGRARAFRDDYDRQNHKTAFSYLRRAGQFGIKRLSDLNGAAPREPDGAASAS